MSAGPDAAAQPADPVADRAGRIETARRRGFGSLMALIERLFFDAAAEDAGGARPGEERIRFRHDPRLSFAPSDVARVEQRTLPPPADDFSASPRPVLEVTTAFLGLTGTAGPLPPYLCEEVAQEEADQTRLRDFLDLFHHRILTLFQRARSRSDLPGGHRADLRDDWSRRILAVLGIDQAALARSAAPGWRLLRWAPLLAERNPTGPAIEAAVEDAVGEEVLGGARATVEPFAGAWVEIAPDERSQLGRSASVLGRDLLLGRRIFDRAGKFRVVIGPLGAEGFARFTSGREPLRRVAQAVTALTTEPIDWQVVLWLSADAAPRLELSARGKTRLGRNSWLGGQVRETRIPVEVPA
ncbi:MAG TPA: type VI secretion system baseplate subunit TssG [Anaeromyxobacteraceae bacterium]